MSATIHYDKLRKIMPDFFEHPCGRQDGHCNITNEKPCKTVTTERRFGIIDDISDDQLPAFLQLFKDDEWDLTVEKASDEVNEVLFKAIDKCMVFPPPAGSKIKNKICEGMLVFNDYLIFIEIKYRTSSGYKVDSVEKFERTIQVFKASHGLEKYNNRIAVVCNSSKLVPATEDFSLTDKDKFYDANDGFDLYQTKLLKLP